jgi:hypothetical protein
MATPELLCPQVVESFDGRVVIGLAQGNEQHLDAHGPTQTHHLAEYPGMIAAAEGAFVVKLSHIRHAELLPSLQQVLTRGSGSFGGMRAGVDVVALDVDRVEGLYDFTSRNPTGNDIGDMDGMRIRRIRVWAIRMMAWRWRLGGEMVTREHPLHGSQTGRGLRVAATPLLLNRACSHQGKAQARLAVSHYKLA